MIKMDPEMAQIFQASTAVSSEYYLKVLIFKILIDILFNSIASKGISANLLQSGSKRRRTKQQIEDEKQAKLLKQQEDAAKVAQYDALQMKVQMME